MRFSKDLIKLDCPKVIDELVERLKDNVYTKFRRQGVVVGTSGGVDSSVMRKGFRPG